MPGPSRRRGGSRLEETMDLFRDGPSNSEKKPPLTTAVRLSRFVLSLILCFGAAALLGALSGSSHDFSTSPAPLLPPGAEAQSRAADESGRKLIERLISEQKFEEAAKETARLRDEARRGGDEIALDLDPDQGGPAPDRPPRLRDGRPFPQRGALAARPPSTATCWTFSSPSPSHILRSLLLGDQPARAHRGCGPHRPQVLDEGPDLSRGLVRPHARLEGPGAPG